MRPLVLVLCVVATVSFADSPLTSIEFAPAYANVPAVKAALGGKSEAAYRFLTSDAPNDQKLAVANALGWQRDWATGFLAFVAKKHDVSEQQLAVTDLSTSELFVAGYLVAMASYLDLKPLRPKEGGVFGMAPEALLDKAAELAPQDFSVQYARALVQAQPLVQGDWCKVFTVPRDVVLRFPPRTRNLRPAALKAAEEYLSGYEESCADSKAAATKRIEELNQIYTVSRVGSQVVAGTQGGVVVWDPKVKGKPVATRQGFICHGITWKKDAWLGCQSEVVRWNGSAFTAFKPTPQKNASSYYYPMEGPDGQLWVRRDKDAWKFDEPTGVFTRVKPPWSDEAYDARYLEGEAYWIDFMRGIHVGAQLIPIHSERYPGNDPRSFSVDATGALWVADFESGLYRWETDRFVKKPGVDDKGIGVAVDVEHKRRWLLHYTKGLVLQREGQPDERVELRGLDYMRDLLLDPATGDVWVAGWTELARVSSNGTKWELERFRVR